MPIVDALIVQGADVAPRPDLAHALAVVVARALQSRPGTVWVRLQYLDSHLYAEDTVMDLADASHPVFLRMLVADLPAVDELQRQVSALTAAVAGLLDRRPERIHIEYAPSARGRVAFGGTLLS